MNRATISASASLLLAALFGMASCATPEGEVRSLGRPSSRATTSLDGAPASPLVGKTGRLALFVFLADGCPVARAMSPEIERIGREAIDAGVRVALIYPDPLVKPADIREHNRDFGLTLPTLLDPSHTVVDAVGATISPEAALIRFRSDGGFDLLYRGRINDLYAAPGRRRPSATTRDLAAALEAALEGRAPEPARTGAVGCGIEPLSSR
jgi:thiol-disulfide isomerase/thioredoxin